MASVLKSTADTATQRAQGQGVNASSSQLVIVSKKPSDVINGQIQEVLDVAATLKAAADKVLPKQKGGEYNAQSVEELMNLVKNTALSRLAQASGMLDSDYKADGKDEAALDVVRRLAYLASNPEENELPMEEAAQLPNVEVNLKLPTLTRMKFVFGSSIAPLGDKDIPFPALQQRMSKIVTNYDKDLFFSELTSVTEKGSGKISVYRYHCVRTYNDCVIGFGESGRQMKEGLAMQKARDAAARNAVENLQMACDNAKILAQLDIDPSKNPKFTLTRPLEKVTADSLITDINQFVAEYGRAWSGAVIQTFFGHGANKCHYSSADLMYKDNSVSTFRVEDKGTEEVRDKQASLGAAKLLISNIAKVVDVQTPEEARAAQKKLAPPEASASSSSASPSANRISGSGSVDEDGIDSSSSTALVLSGDKDKKHSDINEIE